MYYYNARYYDPELARFIQPDTIIPGRIASSSQVLNRYSYVLNNPLKYIDPSGHFFGSIGGFLGGIFGGIGGFFGGILGGIGGFIGGFIGGIGGLASGAFASIGAIAGAAAVNVGSLANFAVGIGAGVASAVGQIASAAATGLWNAGSFTLDTLLRIAYKGISDIYATASAVYGLASAVATDAWKGPLRVETVTGEYDGRTCECEVKAYRSHEESGFSYAPGANEVHTSLYNLEALMGEHGPAEQARMQSHFGHEIGHACGQAPALGPFYLGVWVLSFLHHGLNFLLNSGYPRTPTMYFPIISMFEKDANRGKFIRIGGSSGGASLNTSFNRYGLGPMPGFQLITYKRNFEYENTNY